VQRNGVSHNKDLLVFACVFEENTSIAWFFFKKPSIPKEKTRHQNNSKIFSKIRTSEG
jgi:hypothetical protein